MEFFFRTEIIKIEARYPIKFLLKCSLCLLFAALFASPVTGSGIEGLFFCGLLYAAGYCVCAWIVRPLENGDIARLSAVNQRLGRLISPFCAKARLDSLGRV